MKRFAKILISMFFCLLCLPAFAVKVGGLYATQVAVGSYSKPDRQAAIKRGLSQVFIKTSGNTSVNTLPKIHEALTHAENYVQQYAYKTQKNNEQEQIFLEVSFQEKSIKNFLRQAGQGIWDNERPLLSTWIVMTDPAGRHLISENAENNVPAVINTMANHRGLKIVLPILDLEDRVQITPEDVWMLNVDRLTRVAKRYDSEAILVGRLRRSDSNWTADWILWNHGEKLEWHFNDISLKNIVSVGVNAVADSLAERYAVLDTGHGSNSVMLRVHHVGSSEDYSRVLEFLQNLSPVSEVQVTSVEPDSISYELKLMGNVHALEQAISMHSIIAPLDHQAYGETTEALEYSLL